MVEQLFFHLAIVLIAAVGISVIMRFLRQPLLVGYILTGLLLGYIFSSLNLPPDVAIKQFSQLGLAFLLFMVGLNLNPKVIREIGPAAGIIGLGQVIFTTIVGYFIIHALGFSSLPSLYLSVALTLSSTIIITKLLTDKGDIDTLYGKISIGFLIVQDLIALIIMMIISSVKNLDTHSLASSLSITFMNGGAAIIILGFLGIVVFPRFLKLLAKSQEMLFIFSLAWCFLVATLFSYLNFSIELGALLAGVILAMSPYATDISSKVRPLRDFFIVVFFISLGMQMSISQISAVWFPSLVLSLFILIGNPLIVILLMGILGYTKKVSFFVGLIVAQISEFSIILIAQGISLGYLPAEMLPLITLTGIITLAISAYWIIHSDSLYRSLEPYIPFKHYWKRKEPQFTKEAYDIILFGYNRLGYSLLKSLEKLHKKYLIIDFNPETVLMLKKKGIPALYSDADNSDMLEELQKPKLVVSTIPSLETNSLIIEKMREKKGSTILIALAHHAKDALSLYRSGADYVIVPHLLGGEYASKIVENYKIDKHRYAENKSKHIKELKQRISDGQEHHHSK